MKFLATNRKLRSVLTAIHHETLVPNWDFKRRLVWSTKHKKTFIETVLLGYPFPEIYVASGNIDSDTGEMMEWVVDGQQRITTLYQYYVDFPDIIATGITPYSELRDEEKQAFLDYPVTVRDLGKTGFYEIQEIFKRINSPTYGLNALEIENVRFDGELKQFSEQVARDKFFEKHHVFSPSEIRNKQDTRFTLTYVVTIMSTFFHRERELKRYLEYYNDLFPEKKEVASQIQQAFRFIENCGFSKKSRVWQKADLFSLLVEIQRFLIRKKQELDPVEVGKRLKAFYTLVDKVVPKEQTNQPHIKYLAATAQEVESDRSSRITRAKILQRIIEGEFEIESQATLPSQVEEESK